MHRPASTSQGKHVSDNGHDLAWLLDGLLAAWPEQVDDLLLVGHSMGGLVIRSACHYGSQAAAQWTERVRHIFYLGSPHLGAPLARAAGLAGWALGQAPETRPFVTLVNGSSPGIKDLRHGYLLSDDWDGCDQDNCLRDHRGDVPLLAGPAITPSAPPLRPIQAARSALSSATCSSGRPAPMAGAAIGSTSPSRWNRATGSAACITSTCSTIPRSGPL